jgi:hypothetical protein
MCDTFNGEIIVRRTNTAAGEHVVEALGESRDFPSDNIDIILDRGYLLNLYSQLPQLGAEKMGIRVPRFA